MKSKKIAALAAAAALVASLSLAACGNSQPANDSNSGAAPEQSQPAQSAAPEKAPAAEQAPAQQAPAAEQTPAQQAPAQQAQISPDEAKSIALGAAGFGEADVMGLSIELDTDDAVVHYDVDFKNGGIEYSYDVDAASGAIISSEQEADD